MKKTYEAPSVEKIAFKYRDQVVVASGGGTIPEGRCIQDWVGEREYIDNCHIEVVQSDAGIG